MGAWFLCFMLLVACFGSGQIESRPLHGRPRPTSLFAFGNSYVDTGNIWLRLVSSWRPPYGMTFPGNASGRFSDGRVFTDYVASYLGNPSPFPYRLKRGAQNRTRFGMNFAYGGSGVFDTYFIIPNMSTQIGYFEQLIQQGVFPQEQLESSVALISISGNDYFKYLFQDNRPTQGLKGFMELVVRESAKDIERVSLLGLGKVVVMGLEPVGCLPILSIFRNYSSCLDDYNQYAAYHNTLLNASIDAINANLDHPRVLMLDLYRAFLSVLQGQGQLGKRFPNPLTPCCVGLDKNSYCSDVD